jgi:hypothetical protein
MDYFWREDTPWLVLQLPDGRWAAAPVRWTDLPVGTDRRIGSNLGQVSSSVRSSGSKRISEVVYFAVLFRGTPVIGE